MLIVFSRCKLQNYHNDISFHDIISYTFIFTVRMSLASMQGKKFSMKTMIKENGLMSVYDGLVAGVSRQIFYATSRFGLFETCRDILHDIRGKTDFAGR